MTTTPLLATKLYLPPPQPKVVLRPRLLELLNAGLHGKLTLIAAPAGFGKTTLVSSWVATLPQRVAWLSLDADDRTPARFFSYVIAALQTVVAGFGEAVMVTLQSPQPPPTPTLLTALLNEIAALPDNFLLVLDDYHLVDDGEVDQALAFLLEHLPPQLHVVMTTREDPRLPLARWRARRQLTEVRVAELRFTPVEATAFLNEMMGLGLAAEQVSALEARTEGWIAGLQLAALSMRGRDDLADFIATFTGDHRYIVDYLVEEVLQRQPTHIRSFLLQSSILDRLSGPLCDAVTERTDSHYLLETLERGNLFVMPLDDTRTWFRYHRLFADVLAAYAQHEQPAQLPPLHQRASAWYAAHGYPAAAIRHAFAAQDFPRAAALVELVWPEMDGRFAAVEWLRWARALPDALVRARPVLSVAYAWALLSGGELEAAEMRLAEAEAWLEDAGQTSLPGEMVVVDAAQFATLPASIATARAYISQARGDLPATVLFGQRALDLLPATDYLRRGPAAALLGLAQWGSGDLEQAYQTLADAMAGFQKAGNLNFALSVTSGLVDIRTTQGRLREAVKVNRAALQIALAQGEPLVQGTANLYMGLAELYHAQGADDAAVEHLLRCEELGAQAGLPNWRYHYCRASAQFKASAGDLTAALAWLDEAERNYYRSPVPDVRPVGALRARLWLAQGRLADAQRWAQDTSVTVDDDLSFLREFEHITLARILLAAHAHPAAIPFLNRLQDAAAAGGRLGSVIEIRVLLALAYEALGDPSAALAALGHALKLAAPEGYVRIFVAEGQPMARLLATAAGQNLLPDYCATLLAAITPVATPVATTPSTAPPPPAQPLIEPLSARELEVLRLIAQGLSNEAIAAQLFLALSTVKGHNQAIFAKLQVQRRTEAVARARALGLL